MRIAVTATGPSLDHQVEARFGRTPYYILVDTETMEFEVIENPNAAVGGGAGIQSAKLMLDHGVRSVLTGNCGPNAYRVFDSAGIDIIVGITGTVRKALEQFKAGSISPATRPNVVSHFGMGGGQGMGMGRGSGRGMGGGQGMGQGSGRGIGGGQGMGRSLYESTPGTDIDMESHTGMTGEEEIALLKKQSYDIERRIKETARQIDKVKENNGRVLAHVDPRMCRGCGVCESFCPVRAITVNDIAVIDADKCTGCGACMNECAFEAISLY